MKVKIKELVKGLYTEAKDENGNVVPLINPKGDCIDLRAAEDYIFHAPQAGVQYQKDNVKFRDVKFDEKMISLGIAMQLPKGYVGKIRQRSSTTKNLRLLSATSGYIDNCYNGNKDEWKFYCFSVDNTVIHKGDRICQFEICLSQYATVWQKIKWLFSKPKFVFVDQLNNESRGGHGTSGVK